MPRKLSLLEKIRRTVIGAPIHTAQAHHEKLPPILGLPVFSSDSLSSVAYATEAILMVLILAGTSILHEQIWITLSICVLIILIVISYTQTIFAYPKGGGSYIVASDNLGKWPGLVAGAALLIDYILTVAVSIAAGAAAWVSAIPAHKPFVVEIAVVAVAVVAWLNLRGARESGIVFAIPTYGFVLGIMAMLVVAVIKSFTGADVVQQVTPSEATQTLNHSLFFLTLRAFAAGCTALTGIEAVSDGVQSFREPAAKNASRVLKWMGFLLITMFLGIGYVSQHIPNLLLLPAHNPASRTLTSQIAAYAFGLNSFGFYYVQFATVAILVLAANTAFADFPRVASFLARDGFLPRPFARQGDRMVFHNGIIVLGAAAVGLIFVFHGELEQLLPLYAVGVFTAFTLSQAGMVSHWLKLKTPGWIKSLVLNVIGGTLTLIVALIILITKWEEGAWIVAILLLVLIAMFMAINLRYGSMAKQLALVGEMPKVPGSHRTILMVPRVHKGIIQAVEYALAMDPNMQAIHVTIDERSLPALRRDWDRYCKGVPLTILPSPYRSLIRPILDYVDEQLEQNPDQIITMVVPEAVSTKWYQKVLHENVAAQLKAGLAQRKNVVITSVRYFLD